MCLYGIEKDGRRKEAQNICASFFVGKNMLTHDICRDTIYKTNMSSDDMTGYDMLSDDIEGR